MASKYKTGHTIPPEFPDILKDFVREVLREQPANIFSFGAAYFQDKSDELGGTGGDGGAVAGMSEDALVEYLTSLFVAADVDKNGVLDRLEFKRLMQEADLGLSVNHIKLLYSQADVNEDGCIEYREFIPACVELIITLQQQRIAQIDKEEKEMEAQMAAEDYFYHGMSREELELMLRESFKEADTDGSGFLDMKEFQAYLRKLPLNLTKKEINMAMVEVDANQDGKVSLEEFLPLFHMIMVEMIKNSILDITRETSELASYLIACCAQYDQDGTGFLPANKVSRGLRDADLGLSKFQILQIVGAAEQGGNGIQYEPFIVDTAAKMVEGIANAESETNLRRAQAFRQVIEAEAVAEEFLGVPRDEFAQVMGSVFKQYDADNSGYLDMQEFENAVRNSGIPFTPDMIRMLMAAADSNEDGQIQYGEFAEVAVQLMAYMQREEQIMAQMETIGEEEE